MTSERSGTGFWKNRKVFVTGCTGLLGSHLSESLVVLGAEVTGLIRDQIPRNYLSMSNTIQRMNVVNGDVEDYDLIERSLNEYEIQTIFHLAAQTIVGTANRNPLSTFSTNINGTWNILEAARRNTNITEILIASSDKAYGANVNLPYNEDTPLRGSHPYDVSKSCADLLAQSYFATYQLPVAITRCGNLFGGGDLNFNRLIPGTIRSIYNHISPEIRSDGKSTRDYIYVKDAVSAYTALAASLSTSDSIRGQAFNVSYESPMSAIDVVTTILTLTDRSNLNPRILDQATNEIPHQFLNSKKFRTILKWAPDYTFESAMRETLMWYKSFFEGQITNDT